MNKYDVLALVGMLCFLGCVAEKKACVKDTDDDATANSEKKLNGVQLWENGPYWSECNVGAMKPEECGYYFWWGDTVGYKRDGTVWVSSSGERMSNSPFDFRTCPTHGKSTSQLQSAGYVDARGELMAEHDAAIMHLGVLWRMPTAKEINDLIRNCDITWTELRGVWGYRVIGKGAYSSKSIFFPAAGYDDGPKLCYAGWCGHYWSSTSSDNAYDASMLGFSSNIFDLNCNARRYIGRPVRPLR